MENMGNRENRDMGQWGNRERIGQMGHIENRDMGKMGTTGNEENQGMGIEKIEMAK